MAKKLVVEIIGDTSSLDRAFRNTTKGAGGLGSALSKLGKIAAVGVGAGFVGLGIVMKKGFDEMSEGQKVAAQTAARLKSTGEAANVTAKQVGELATAQSKLTGIDDEAVQAGENMLLTFTNIRNEVGKNNDIFNQTTVAVEDMATAMNDGAIPSGEQLSTTAIRIGKALNDPIKGVGALARVGVQFTEAQKKQIAAMVKSGDTMGAQKLILAELTKEFGGSAKAAGETFPGQLAKLRNAFDDASSKVAVVFLPALVKVMGFITDKLIPALGNAANFIGDFWKGISKQFAKAPTIGAKINVVFKGVENLAKQLVDALFSQIERLLPQKPLIFQPQTKVAVGGGGVDWQKTADDMLTGLAAALAASAVLAQALAKTITDAIDKVDWIGVGQKMGPFLATMLLSAIVAVLDPAFWIRNWKLVLAVAVNALTILFPEFFAPGRIAGALSKPLIAGIARISPELGAAFGRLMADSGKVALVVLEKLGPQLTKLTQAIFGKLTKIAVFTIRVLGVVAAISAIEDFVRAAIGKFKELLNWLDKLPGKIEAKFSDAGTWLTAAGAAIIQGLWDGAKSKVGGFLSWLGGLKKLIPLHKGPPGQDRMLLAGAGELIMQGLQDGMITGWKGIQTWLGGLGKDLRKGIYGASPEFVEASRVLGVSAAKKIIDGFRSEQPSIAQQMKTALRDAVKEAIKAANQAVVDARGAFASAFSSLADAALAAFDAKMAAYKPPKQVLLDKRALEKQTKDLQDAINKAGDDLNKAREAYATALTGGDQAAIDSALQARNDAQKAYDDALYNQQTFTLEQQAIQQQKKHDERAAAQRKDLESDLNDVKTWLAKHPGEYEKATAKINVVLKQHGIDSRFWGGVIGEELAKGIRSSEAAVAAAAEALAKALRKKLKLHSNAEEGPLSDLDTWWSGLIPTLLAGVDFSKISEAGQKFAGAFKDNIAALKGTSPADSKPMMDSLGTVTESFDTTTTAVETLTTAITSLPTLAATALNALNGAVVAALKKLPEFLSPVTQALLDVASAIGSIGTQAYQTRDALRDTADEIEKLRRQISGGGGNPPGRQHGGYVRAGGSYLVGEVGPELFTPSTSGTIHSNAATSSMTSSAMVVNLLFNGPTVGTSREFEDTVRRALYDVQRRNPGSGLALA